MRNLSLTLNTLIRVVMVVCLTIMASLVFTNVVLRYVFSSGLTWTEELASFLFVWMIFLGAIEAMRSKEHLSVNILLNKFSSRVRQIITIINYLILLFIMWLLFEGSWSLTVLNKANKAPATGIPYSFIYGIVTFTSVCMTIIIVVQLYRIIFHKGGD